MPSSKDLFQGVTTGDWFVPLASVVRATPGVYQLPKVAMADIIEACQVMCPAAP